MPGKENIVTDFLSCNISDDEKVHTVPLNPFQLAPKTIENDLSRTIRLRGQPIYSEVPVLSLYECNKYIK